MMEQKFSIEYFISIAGIIGVLIGIGFFSWIKMLKETNSILKNQNTELKEINTTLTAEITALKAELVLMRMEIDTLKSVPLMKIDAALAELTKTNTNMLDVNSKILHRLTQDAKILIRTTKISTAAVKQVKEDLEGEKA